MYFLIMLGMEFDWSPFIALVAVGVKLGVLGWSGKLLRKMSSLVLKISLSHPVTFLTSIGSELKSFGPFT